MFVPNADFGSRKDTAIVLLGTAADHGINPRTIKAVNSGFEISEELAAVLYAEDNQTSGNRAAKKNSEEESA